MTVLDDRDLWSLVARRASLSPDRVLVVDEHGREVTFAEFRLLAERAAAGLHALGVRQGTRVMWMLPTWIESLVLSAALSRLGAIQVPLIPVYRQREIGFIARQTSAPMMLVPAVWRGTDYVDLATSATSTMDKPPALITVDRSLPEGDPATLPPPPAPPSRSDLRWIFYTSGTTSDPKGAKHSDATIAASSWGMIEPWRLTDDDVMTLIFPYAHIGGVSLLIIALMAGNQLIIVEAFDRTVVVDALTRYGVTLAGSGPAFWRAYIDAQQQSEARLFPRLRLLIGGGAAKPANMQRDARAVLGVDVVSGYGLTECPALVLNHSGDPDDVLATDGRTMVGAEMRIVRLDGVVAEPNQDGEIQVRGDMLFLGYLDEALDDDALAGDGWLRTGDLGRMDARGQLTVAGRLKDVIIRKGENISAKEVEDVLIEHRDVRDVAVIGLPDDERGERCCAVAVPIDPARPPTLDALVEHCIGAGLMRQKIPEQLEVVDALPYNSTGKVLKADLRKRFQ
ncbi:MAG TPA: AMP-binding protein [Acidimicrobiales bacterium]|nr:AMP-binding protein [Acidimicrobiales bacterium]